MCALLPKLTVSRCRSASKLNLKNTAQFWHAPGKTHASRNCIMIFSAVPLFQQVLASRCGAHTCARWVIARLASTVSEDIAVLTMPQLSPTMTSGTLVKVSGPEGHNPVSGAHTPLLQQWHKQPGEDVHEYDLIMTVSTSNLTETAYKVSHQRGVVHVTRRYVQVGDFAGDVKLVIEVQEDGIMGPHFVKEGTTLPVRAHTGGRCASHAVVPTGWNDCGCAVQQPCCSQCSLTSCAADRGAAAGDMAVVPCH